MGQRIQILFKIPELFYNSNNPNNRKESIIVYHNQWKYGRYLIIACNNLIKYIKEGEDYYKRTGFAQNLLEVIEYAINKNNSEYMRASKSTLVYNTNEDYKEDDYSEDYKQRLELKNLNDLFDNNNGFLLLDLTKKTPEYKFISGLEDSPENIPLTPLDYLRLFQDDTQTIKSYDWEVLKAIEEIEKEYMEIRNGR